MGQCFAKQDVPIPLSMSPRPRITQVAPNPTTRPCIRQVSPNPPKKRLQRTHSKIIYDAITSKP